MKYILWCVALCGNNLCPAPTSIVILQSSIETDFDLLLNNLTLTSKLENKAGPYLIILGIALNLGLNCKDCVKFYTLV